MCGYYPHIFSSCLARKKFIQIDEGREHRLRCSRLCYTLFSCPVCCFAFHSAYSRCPSSLSKNDCISGSRTQARASTVRSFQVRDLDLENRVLFTRHIKNNRPQPLPLCSDMVAILQEYLTYREGKAHEPLFPSDADQPMTENGLRCSIADDNRRRGGKRLPSTFSDTPLPASILSIAEAMHSHSKSC